MSPNSKAQCSIPGASKYSFVSFDQDLARSKARANDV